MSVIRLVDPSLTLSFQGDDLDAQHVAEELVHAAEHVIYDNEDGDVTIKSVSVTVEYTVEDFDVED